MYKPVYGKRRIEYDEDSETYLDLTDGTLVGHCILDMRYSYENFYFQTAQLIIKTFDTNWNLADNIIETGVVIEIKAFDV